MAGRASLVRAEPGFSLPFFDRVAPPPPPALVDARIEAQTGPGDVILDLHGRGGWIARAAVDRQRRAVSIESNPLTRLLAELVLRPPDLRHLDAAFQAMSASPRGPSSLKVAVGDLFATRCATCGRMLVADELIWDGSGEGSGEAHDDGDAQDDGGAQGDRDAHGGAQRHQLARKHYRCPVCRSPRGGEARHAEPDDDDRRRAAAAPDDLPGARERLRERFPVLDGGDALVDALLDLHTPRQLVGLEAILDRIEGDLRAAPVQAALRLGLLHAILPASRLNSYPGRVGSLRIQAGKVRQPSGGQWRERNPWLAFEDGIRLVRGFVQRLEGASHGVVHARLGDDLRSLTDGTATAILRLAGPTTARAIGAEAGTAGGARRVRLVLGQPPVRPNQERLSAAYHATAWVLGRDAAATLPLEPLFGSAIRAPWGWQAASLGRSLAAIESAIAPDGRVALLVDSGGADGLVAAVLGGVSAGFRLVDARLGESDDEIAGIVELVPPGAVMAPGPRTRANVSLEPADGGLSDPDIVAGRGLFGAPEPIDRRPFTRTAFARTISDVAVETLRARGEPAREERLLGSILVGLDRAGQLRRLVAGEEIAIDADAPAANDDEREQGPDGPAGRPPAAPGQARPDVEPGRTVRTRRSLARSEPATDQVERLVGLVREELARPDQRRLREIEPGRWWLADRADQAAAAAPLADRVEWAVYSLLSTGGPLSEDAFFERIAALFTGYDLPDEALVRACLQSYRSRASTADRLITADDLLARSHDHSETIAGLAEGGHRLGMQVWIGRREQSRKVGSRRLSEWLDEREQRAYLSHVSRAVDAVGDVDCIWYVRSRLALLFEVEWTAMLGEPLLRRHARIPQEEQLVRFLVVAPERTELVRHKLERSALLREAMERDNWHVLKWNHLRSFLARDPLSLDDLQQYLGLDPLVERGGEQLPLF
jgi:hypothetical protein